LSLEPIGVASWFGGVFVAGVGLVPIDASGVSEMGSAGRFRPAGLRSCGADGSGEVADQRCLGAGGGEGEADAGCGLDDAGADFQQTQSQRGELGFGERMGLRPGRGRNRECRRRFRPMIGNRGW